LAGIQDSGTYPGELYAGGAGMDVFCHLFYLISSHDAPHEHQAIRIYAFGCCYGSQSVGDAIG